MDSLDPRDVYIYVRELGYHWLTHNMNVFSVTTHQPPDAYSSLIQHDDNLARECFEMTMQSRLVSKYFDAHQQILAVYIWPQFIVYPIRYPHNVGALLFLSWKFRAYADYVVDICVLFSYILQGYFTGTDISKIERNHTTSDQSNSLQFLGLLSVHAI